jgi:hypothetical protein
MTSGLNTSPMFVRALGEMVLDVLGGEESATEKVGEANRTMERLVAAD